MPAYSQSFLGRRMLLIIEPCNLKHAFILCHMTLLRYNSINLVVCTPRLRELAPGSLTHALFSSSSVPIDVPLITNQRVGLYDGAGKEGWFIYSKHHTLISKSDVDSVKQKLTSMQFIPTERSHYFPLEDPHVFADLVASYLQSDASAKSHGS
jgi:hypothetical protein